jgi:hypothetical protein
MYRNSNATPSPPTQARPPEPQKSSYLATTGVPIAKVLQMQHFHNSRHYTNYSIEERKTFVAPLLSVKLMV